MTNENAPEAPSSTTASAGFKVLDPTVVQVGADPALVEAAAAAGQEEDNARARREDASARLRVDALRNRCLERARARVEAGQITAEEAPAEVAKELAGWKARFARSPHVMRRRIASHL